MTKSIDLLLASRFFYPTFGGAAERFRRYAPGLLARGVAMRVLTTTVAGKAEEEPAVAAANVDGIPVHRVPVPFSPVRADFVFHNALAMSCRQGPTPQVVHLLSMSAWSQPAIHAIRHLKVPMIYSYTLASSLSLNPLKRCLQRFCQRWPMRYMDRIVVSSKTVREHLAGLGVRRPMEVIPNGVDLERFAPVSTPTGRAALRRKLDIPQEAPTVVYVGALSRRKGIDLLLAAWPEVLAACPQARLVLVGPSEEDLLSSRWDKTGIDAGIARQVGDPALRSSLILTGWADHVEDYYRAADCFVFPSRREGFGNAIAEAYAAGLPVVLTPFIGLSDELGHAGEHFELTPHEPSRIASGILRMLRDEVYRTRLAQNARHWAEQHLGVNAVLDRYAALYRTVAREDTIHERAACDY